MNKFRHPSVTSGQLNHGAQSFQIVEGVLECPDDIARELGLVPIAAESTGAAGGKKSADDKGGDAQVGIAKGNADTAKEVIAAAETLESLAVLEAEEATRKDGVRVSVTRAIADRRAQLEEAAKQ